MKIQFEYINTNGIQLHTALTGPQDGVPVIMLHGFPEAWFGWENQILALAEAGFRVIAPDQRGYNLSTKPIGVKNYQTKNPVKDIIGLARSLDLDSFYLAGHDWGAMVAWSLAMVAPRRIKRLAIANVPHPAVFSSYLRAHPSQMIKSWYALFFQLPWLPEQFVKAGNWKFLLNAMPKYWDEDQRDRYREVWGQPGAITAMINWYRAAFAGSPQREQSRQVEPETLIIWGKKDPHLSWQMAEPSLEYCQDGRLVFFEDATHWVQHDKAKEVSQLLVDHFSKG
jgi:pimeloyl-ACP methyl ester carboxylesterase